MTQTPTNVAPEDSYSLQAISTIVHEHQALWRILDLLDQLQHDMNINEQQPDETLFSTIFDYVQHFARRVHSSPEEIVLYRLLGDKSEPEEYTSTVKFKNGLLGGQEYKTGRYTFTTKQAMGSFRFTEPLSSGLLGPVRILATDDH